MEHQVPGPPKPTPLAVTVTVTVTVAGAAVLAWAFDLVPAAISLIQHLVR